VAKPGKGRKKPKAGLIPPISRRMFITSASAAAAGAALVGAGLLYNRARMRRKKLARPKETELKVGFIGTGSQGRNLILASVNIPGVRFTAIADIWPYHQQYAANILKEYGMPVSTYADYQDMLSREKLDAVIIATPDWVHAEQAISCMKAGVHVYCEKEMATTIEDCRRMVRTARDTRKLLQIGHQRRSNPRYLHSLGMIEKDNLLGRITHTFGQWNRVAPLDLGWPKKHALGPDLLKRYGYDTMERFRNWRWYRKFSSGPIADLGSHQVDIFSWFLKARPSAVLATGGKDFPGKREWYDNVMAIYEYRIPERGEVPAHDVRGFYQVLNSTSHGGYYETFMGTDGSLVISEDPRTGFLYREVAAEKKDWEDEAEKVKSMDRDAIALKVGASFRLDGKEDPQKLKAEEDLRKPVHQPHLENFFDAIRHGTKLTCPASEAFRTAVPILKTNEAAAAGCRIALKPEDYAI